MASASILSSWIDSIFKSLVVSRRPPKIYSDVWTDHILIDERIKYKIVFASLADASEDVIVNSVGSPINLSKDSKLAKAIGEKAGPKLEKECAGKELSFGSILQTSSYDMPCDYILHCNAHYYSQDKDCKRLLKTIKDCLEKASSLNAVSVALPAIGMGEKGYPSLGVAKTTLRAVTEFSKANPRTSIKLIKLYLHKPALTQAQIQDFDCEPLAGSDSQPKALTIPALLKFVQGDLAEMKADVIVNSTATHMSLKLGKVATALLNKAGYALQEECTRKAPLYIGDVIVTEGYGLNCDHVFHVSCPDWVQGTSEEKLQQIILACLKKAEELGVASIAFAALGTGLLKYPPEVVGECFIKVVTQYCESNPRTKLLSVFVLAYDKDEPTKKGFEKCIGRPIEKQIIEVTEKKPVVPASLTNNGHKMEIDLPLWWEKPTSVYTEPKVVKGSAEWQEVEVNFLRSLNRVSASIVEILRVQNPATFFQYEARRLNVARSLGKSADKVQASPLWHGTSEDKVKLITCSKFDRAFSGGNVGAIFGKGSYFAKSAQYSSQDGYSKPTNGGVRYMIQTRVITGAYCKGEKSLKSAPYKKGSVIEQYDSVVDDVDNPTIFCVFHDDSAYPEYIIKYKY